MTEYTTDRLAQMMDASSETLGERIKSLSHDEKYNLAQECFVLCGEVYSELLGESLRDTFQRIHLTMDVLFFHELSQINRKFQEEWEKSKEQLEILREIDFFSDASDFDLMTVVADLEERHMKAGEAFLVQGEEVHGAFLLRDKADVFVDGREEPVVTRRGIFGEEACATDAVEASATVKTTKEGIVFYIAREDFVKHIKRIPKLQGRVFRMVVDRAKYEYRQAKRAKEYAEEQQRLTQEILDNIGQGSFSINQAGEIQNYSIFAKDYLGRKNMAGAPFADIAFRKDRKALREYYQALNLLFGSNQFDPEVILSLLPNEVTIKKRIFKLSYFFVQDKAGYVMSVFVRMEEVTQERALQAQEEREKRIADKMHQNIGGFLRMLEEVEEGFHMLGDFSKNYEAESISPDSDFIGDLMRKLHGAKGLSGQYELLAMRDIIHRMEDCLRSIDEEGPDDQMDLFERLLQQYENEYKQVLSLKEGLGPDIIALLEGVSFSQEEFRILINAVNDQDLSRIRPLVIQKIHVPAKTVAENWETDIVRLSEQIGKKIRFQLVIKDDLTLPESLARILNIELAHLYRNCVDHGVELPQKRRSLGKPETGSITLKLHRKGKLLMVILSDDGAGLDHQKIISFARRKAHLNQALVERYIEQGKPWKILFMSGFSSAAKVTKLSGRGVGMDAVETAIRQLRGKITMASQKNQGSVFAIQIPLDPNDLVD